MPIRRLSVQLANQIAAGEVVERPASVVKELMENAIDAHASLITLEIAKAGKVLIKVTDDGQGIPKDELTLALAPHATSKIAKLEDLSGIMTLGFRGEALASIASVSKLTLVSCTKEQPHAFQVQVDGPDQNPDVQPAAHPIGTSVIVRELFFNTPARRSFLKADKTEFNQIKEVFTRIALVNYQVGFKFISDGKVLMQLPPVQRSDLLQRIGKLLGIEFKRDGMYFDSSKRQGAVQMITVPLNALPSENNGPFQHECGLANSISGDKANLANDASQNDSLNQSQDRGQSSLSPTLARDHETFQLQDKEAKTDSKVADESSTADSFDLSKYAVPSAPIMKLFGVLLPPPSLTKALPDRLLTFLNGRVIADKTVNHAIREGYIDSVLKPHETYKPSVRAVIFMECDPHIVDVNVHPRKDEVRFHNASQIHECIKREIMAVMEAYGINQQTVGQAALDQSLLLDKDKLQARLESKPDPTTIAQQRLNRWHNQVAKSEHYTSSVAKETRNQALQKVIADYFAKNPQPLHLCNNPQSSLPGCLCDLAQLRTPEAELGARRQAQQAFNQYHATYYGSAVKLNQHTQNFLEHVEPIPITNALRASTVDNTGHPSTAGNSIHLNSGDSVGHPSFDNNQTADTDAELESFDLDATYPQTFSSSSRPLSIVASRLQQKEQAQAAHKSQLIGVSVYPQQQLVLDSELLDPQQEAQTRLYQEQFLGQGVSALESAQKLQQRYNEQMRGMQSLYRQDSVDANVHAEANAQLQADGAGHLSSDLSASGLAAAGTYAQIPDVWGQRALSTESTEQRGAEVNNATDNFTDTSTPAFASQYLSDVNSEPSKNELGQGASSMQGEQGSQSTANLNYAADKLNPNTPRNDSEQSNTDAQINTNGQINADEQSLPSRYLSLVAHDIILFMLDERYYVGRGSELFYSWVARDFKRRIADHRVESFDLNMDFAVRVERELLSGMKQPENFAAAERCGFEIRVNSSRYLLEIRKIPSLLAGTDLAHMVPNFLNMIMQEAAAINLGSCSEHLAQKIARVRRFEISTEVDAKQLISKIDSRELLQGVRYPSDIKELKLLNLALSMKQHDEEQ